MTSRWCSEDIRLHVERWLLRDVSDAEALLDLERSIVGLLQPPEDLEKRRLAGAVAADQPNAFGFEEREVRMIQQRDVAECQLGIEKSDECHVARIIGAGALGRRSRRVCRSVLHATGLRAAPTCSANGIYS